jgi:hypothetical protein
MKKISNVGASLHLFSLIGLERKKSFCGQKYGNVLEFCAEATLCQVSPKNW